MLGSGSFWGEWQMKVLAISVLIVESTIQAATVSASDLHTLFWLASI